RWWNFRHEWIEIIDVGTPPLQELDQPQSRALSHVVDVFLIGNAEKEYARPVKALALAFIQGDSHFARYVVGHCPIDFTRKLYESGRDSVLAGLPGEIERVYGNAVPPEPRPWVERHESKGLGLRGVDHLPDINAHRPIDKLQFVDERNIDGTEDILCQ